MIGIPVIEEANGLKRYENYVIPALTKASDSTVEPFVTPEFKKIASNDGDADAHIPIHVLASPSSSDVITISSEESSEEESTVQKFELPFAQDAFVCHELFNCVDPLACSFSSRMQQSYELCVFYRIF